MNIVLWILAGVLAAVFATTGASKLIVSRERLVRITPFVEDFPLNVVRGIGALEILGAVGLILPGLLGIAPILTACAAAALAIMMVFALLVHVRRGDGIAIMAGPILLAAAATLVAWGRMGPYPF
ncbi:DoxX family protein [Brachybacterium sp. DNPG3]